MRAAQGVTGDMRTAASDVLVALARSHFHFVMPELQSHLKAMGKVPDEIVLLTLGKMARSYALRCIPFVRMTLLALRATLSQVGSGRMLRTVCSVLEQWSKGVNTYFCNREQCPFPCEGVAQFCEAIYPVFRYAAVHWLDCKEEEDKQAVLRAVAAMMEVLLHEEQYREHAWEHVLWLLHRYQEVRDTSRVTESLSYVLEMLEAVQTPIPQGTALAISTAVHRQLSDVTKEPGLAHKAALSRCITLQARMCPEETVMFLHSQLSGGTEAGRVAALGLLGALAHSDAPAVREKLPQVVEAMGSVCHDPSAQVRRAVLEFIRELLSSGSQSCWAWDAVGHIFIEFSRSSGRLVAGGLFPWETQEDGALRALCMDILGSLDVSLRGMTKLLWPRLLQYVVPAQYSGMLIPLSRCLRALVERWERAGCKEEEEEPDAVDSQEQARLPAPQALLARLLVVVAAPHKSAERAVAALQLLQALHRRIHRALGAAWATEIPLLLQSLEGKTGSCLDSAEWEHRVLKFLRASLEPIEDKAWTVDLSQELSQQLGSSAAGSWEKLFLYKALGTALAACRDLRHVQGQVLRFLQETNPMELSEAQGMISVVSHAAQSHFHLVLDAVMMFSTASTRDGFSQTSMGWKVQQQQQMERAQAIRAALMRTYSGIALRAPKEQLLTRVDEEIVGNILQLSRAKQRERMKKGKKTVRAAVNMQLLHRRGMEDLGHLIETLLEAEETSAGFDDVIHRGHPCEQFGSLVGLLVTLTSDCLAMSCRRAWQSTHRPFLLRARFHQEPLISSLLQKGLPMDSDTVELWRTLGRSTIVIQVLRCLVEKLNRAGNNRLWTCSCACEQHSHQTVLETVMITRAISEVVVALRDMEEFRQLLPHLLPSLLRWASEMLDEERLLSPLGEGWRQLFLEGQVLEEKPCRIFLSAIELVLGKCMAQTWMQWLMDQSVWARLEDALAHPEGVRLLTSVLLQAGLVSPWLVKNLLPWLGSCSVKLRVTATAFFAEVSSRHV
ncbi:maestro heat-like repeat-containing protein family member 2B [Gavia stellata]|uniref:maestro heat-like repeat-containing protein family member 2B n=1 Tax=Gavia stellata TaxID=37040 RepID=UPI0028981C24|nr:maestro heat-like repeat-containing protein family member 2B [Gavia stellata]